MKKGKKEKKATRRTTTPSYIRPFGWVLGQLLSAIGVQQDTLTSTGAKQRSVEKYLNGHHVNAATADAIRATVATQLAELLPTSELLRPKVVGSLIVHHERAWEKFLSGVESVGLASGNPRHILIPFLRMAAIDLSLRLGCWAALRRWDPNDRLPTLRPLGEWLSSEGCTKHLEALLKKGLPELWSLESRAEKIGVAPQSLHEWLHGETTPTAESCIVIANALQQTGALAPLLRARAGTLLRVKLESLTNAHVLDDCIAFSDFLVPHVQERALETVLSVPVTEAQRSAMLFAVATGGFLYPCGRNLLEGLHQRIDLNDEAALDVTALSKGEVAVARRIQCWLQRAT